MLPSSKRLHTSVWLEHMVWANTNRFTQHPMLPILAARMLMQDQASRQAAFGIRQFLGGPTITEDEIRRRMEAGDESVFNMLFTLGGNVTNTAAYWNRFNREVKAGLLDVAYIEQSNVDALPPTLLFNSQSCAEFWWPSLRSLIQQSVDIVNRSPQPVCPNQSASIDDKKLLMYAELKRFPQIVGSYFDIRTVNFYNTVGRHLGFNDVWLRYEFGSNKGHLHSHAVGVSTGMSCMVNKARDDAEALAPSSQNPKLFRQAFANHVFQGLSGTKYDGLGAMENDCGYQSWRWQSRHASSSFVRAEERWVTNEDQWTETKRRPFGKETSHPASRALSEAMESPYTFQKFCVDQDNSCYQHNCTSYCRRPLPAHQRSSEKDKPFYYCRFGFAKLNVQKEVVSHRCPHDNPRFLHINRQWRFEAPVDNWRTLSKPQACRVWNANESCFPILIPEGRSVADAQILPIADYVADYANKATDNIEIARNMYNSLVQAQNAHAQESCSLLREQSLPVQNTGNGSSSTSSQPLSNEESVDKTTTLSSFLHGVMVRLAGLPLLTHLQAVMMLSGTPLHRSTRYTKTVSLTKNRVFRQHPHKRAQPTQQKNPSSEQHEPIMRGGEDDGMIDGVNDEKECIGTLAKFFHCRAQNTVDHNGRHLTLYNWMKRVPCGHRKPVVFPTGVHQLNFTWPLNENWARSMLLLHSDLAWTTDDEALDGHTTFHQALLDLCGLQENASHTALESFKLVSSATPIGLISVVRAAYATHLDQDARKSQELARKRAINAKKTLAAAEDHHNFAASDSEGEMHESIQKESAELWTLNHTDIESKDDIVTHIANENSFDPPPIDHNFHQQGRDDLRLALQKLGLDPDMLIPRAPLPNEDQEFEDQLSQILPQMNKNHTEIKQSFVLQQAELLRCNASQRAAIVSIILPILERQIGKHHPPTRLQLLGEAGSGKTVVLHAIQRLTQRLNAHCPKCVLPLAPTGAVAISMGSQGSTIQNVIPALHTRSASKRNHNRNCLHEEDVLLSDGRLKKLRARIGFDPETSTARVKLLVIDEISMVGASLFWAIHCRLCEALEIGGTRMLENAFASLDITVMGDFSQLNPVCGTSLVTEVTKTRGLNTPAVELFRTCFTHVICLKSQHRLNLRNEANQKLRRLQLHTRDGELDEQDFEYLQSLDFDSKTEAEQDEFLSKRIIHVHFYVAAVNRGNVDEVKRKAHKENAVPTVIINKTKGRRCFSNVEGDVNQLPERGMFVRALEVMCTANGLGYPTLTTTLGIANGTRGSIISVLHHHQNKSNPNIVVIVNFPTYTGPSLIGKHWPTTWVPVTAVTRLCENQCCERTGVPLVPGNHVTLFKCQGLTCGHGREKEGLLLYCEDLKNAEAFWPRSLYVAITRTVDASDLALTNTRDLRMDVLHSINNAAYHSRAKSLARDNEVLSQKIEKELEEYISHDGWLMFLSRVDKAANDGIIDAICTSTDPYKCAMQGCCFCQQNTM